MTERMSDDFDLDFWRDYIPNTQYCWARQDQTYAYYGYKDWWCRYLFAGPHHICVAFIGLSGVKLYSDARKPIDYRNWAPPGTIPHNDNFPLPRAPARRRPYPLPIALPVLEKP